MIRGDGGRGPEADLCRITDRGRALFRQELSRLRLCVGDGEREERAAENLLPGGREEDPS